MDKFICPKDGEIITFKGCVWDDGWEFEAPMVIYEPICRFGDSGSICEESIYELVENVCIDLVCEGEVRKGFSDCELEDFKWRGWNPKRFKYRKSAVHGEFKIRFFKEKNGKMMFEIID